MAQQTTENPLAPPPASPASQTPPPKPPDMVCWGSGPNWSIQFVSWGARYLGINQPDQDFLGGFFWVPEDKGLGVAPNRWPRSHQRIRAFGGHQEGVLHRSCAQGNLPLLSAGQSADGRHGEWMLPQVEAGRSSGRTARRAVQQYAAAIVVKSCGGEDRGGAIEKTRGVFVLRQRVLPVSCWDWPEAVHSTWPQRIRIPITLEVHARSGPTNSTAFRVVRGFRAEALSLSHLTWETTWTINLHIFGSPSFPV